MERPFRSALGKELLAIVEQSLQPNECDIEEATEAHDEAIRRDNQKTIRKINNRFRQTISIPIPWLAEAKRSLAVLESPPPGHHGRERPVKR